MLVQMKSKRESDWFDFGIPISSLLANAKYFKTQKRMLFEQLIKRGPCKKGGNWK